ncbi:Trafficking protein particle complex subunit 5 [Taenia crassiceps]|uniref:Trafficking protein particle complex subunit 5 n=1 Tax=Taenia crassiceps TaxID=6207 RepID=A0ABR4Q3E1_9CEST
MNSWAPRYSQQILEKNLSKAKCDVHRATFMYLFSEMVKYAMQSSNNLDDVQAKLASFGAPVGRQMLDLLFLRERMQKREIRLLSFLVFLKSIFWRCIFGKEADDLERDGLDEHTYYMIEREPVVNKFTRFTYDPTESERKNVPLNLAAFNCGIIESALTCAGFPCKVAVTWHKGTTYVIKFYDNVIAREQGLDSR